MIEEMMKEDLPNLVDERRFRRREPEQFERDEFGRVGDKPTRETVLLTMCSENGQKRKSSLVLSPSVVSTFELRLSVVQETM